MSEFEMLYCDIMRWSWWIEVHLKNELLATQDRLERTRWHSMQDYIELHEKELALKYFLEFSKDLTKILNLRYNGGAGKKPA